MSGDAGPDLDQLCGALTESAEAGAAYLADLFSGDSIGDHQRHSSPEWIHDIYASKLSMAERSMLEDAVMLLLITQSEVHLPDQSPVLVKTLALARHMRLLELGPRRREDRLWVAVTFHAASGNWQQACQVLAYLANAGRARPVMFWTEQLRVLEPGGPLPACFEGVLRHSVDAAISWLVHESGASDAEIAEIMAAYLPQLNAEYRGDLRRLLDAGSFDEAVRRVLQQAMPRYGLRGDSSFVAATETFAAPEGESRTADVYASYFEIDESDLSVFEALRAYLPAENQTPSLSVSELIGLRGGDSRGK